MKILSSEERVRIAKLILSIANQESDDAIADHFRNMGMKTKTDSTRFLGEDKFNFTLPIHCYWVNRLRYTGHDALPELFREHYAVLQYLTMIANINLLLPFESCGITSNP